MVDRKGDGIVEEAVGRAQSADLPIEQRELAREGDRRSAVPPRYQRAARRSSGQRILEIEQQAALCRVQL
ncbi:hypothetical protein D3C72_2535130 [compost metagenome]